MGKKRASEGESRPLFTVKGSPEWHDWLKEASDHAGLNVIAFLDMAVKEKAKREGFDKPMPKRVPRSDK